MIPELSSTAHAIEPAPSSRQLRVLADAAIMPTAIVFLAVFSWLVYPIPYQPSLLIIALVIASFRGGLWIGLLSAAIQFCYAVYQMNGGITDFGLDDETKRRLVLLLIVAPAVVVLVAKMKSVIIEREKSLRDVRERLRAIAGSTSDLVAAFDVDDHSVFVSDSYSKAVEDGALGKKIRFDMFHPEHRQRAKDAYLALKNGGETSVHEYQVTLRGQAEAWVEMRGQGIRNKDGKVTYVVFASRDITQIRKTEQALHEERRKLLLIAETIDEAFWIRDPVSRQLVYATDKWRSLFGIDPDSPRLHEQLLARVHADDIPKVTELLETESIKTPFNIEYRIVMADGSVRWIRSKGGPAKNSDDHQCLVVGASSDITARKVIEEQLLKTQKLEALAHMARQMAHDFNNLLAIILGNLDEAEASLPNNENIIAAQSATLRGAEITKKLLALARQNTGLPVN